MTVALFLIGYVIAVLLIVVIVRMEIRLDNMANKQVTYELFITPDEVIRLSKRDPMRDYFSPRRRKTDHEQKP